ncbi:hypothetical protein RGR602_PB00369 (plasmid) [Rhizobium gallicum bv. gallicum R602sp]|uniref:Uncharacterized protein n=1 Tax=Rhizobium gallicum bv. gallicum R602sp TaxID=1041138 RepID=A0A0B4XAY6_9HYPH|nr:hypothetical protein RGR602_PB00369 [Rhizobium gallicum bv. gallicum R602sp]
MNPWDKIPTQMNLLPQCAKARKLDLAPRFADPFKDSSHVPRMKAGHMNEPPNV